MQINFILSLIFATLIAVFALKNGDKVLIDFLFAKVNVSQAIVIFISAILGAVIVAVLGSVRGIKLKKEIKDLKNKLAEVEDEKDNLLALLEANSLEDTSIEETDDNIVTDGK